MSALATKTFPIERELGEEIHKRILPSGLTLMVALKRGFEKKYALLGTDYGSIDNDFDTSVEGRRVRVPAGIAHFLEHKMFEKKDGDVMDRLAAIGCSSNAMTGFNHTGYLIECTENFEQGLEILVDFVTRPWFTDKLVEKEKGIIAEEINMYRDDPGWRGYMALLENLYGRHPVAVDIAGTVASIQEITAADLLLCHRSFYVPANMHLAVAGDVDVDRVAEIAERVMQRNRPEEVTTDRRLPQPPARPRKKRSEERMSVQAPKLHLGWRIPLEAMTVSNHELDMAIDVFLHATLAKSSPLHARLYAAGLIDDSFGFSASIEREFAFVVLAGDTSKPRELERELVAGMEAAVAGAVPRADLRRARRRLYGSFVRGLDSVSTACWNLIDSNAKKVGYLDYGRDLMKLKDARIFEIARASLRPELSSVHLIRPLER